MAGGVHDTSDILAPLDERQREVATTLLGPVCVLAGAGTGKTTAITRRIAYGVASGVYDPRAVLALTFTVKAAAEMRARLHALGVSQVSARTFHSAALAQLRHFWPQVFGGRVPSLLQEKGRIVAEAADAAGIDVDPSTVHDLAAEIEWRKVRNLSIEDYGVLDRAAPGGLSADDVGQVMTRYEWLLRDRRLLDMEDVLLATVGMLENEPTVADQVRSVYRVFIVDEYQDVSPIQERLLECWLGRRKDVCVVGDASQTIFSFAGASPDFLLRFPERFPGARTIEMNRNYRSGASILAVANRVVSGREGAVRLVGSASGHRPVLERFDTDEEEAASVAGSIAASLHGGTPPERCAVLVRMTGQLETVERALAAAGVPFQLQGARDYFSRPEVGKALLMISAAAARAGGDDPGVLRPTVGDILLDPEIGYTVRPPAPGPDRRRWAALTALREIADSLPEGATLRDLSATLEAMRTARQEPELHLVSISTIHAAKGLEWDEVYLVGASDGLLPSRYAVSPESIEEERRLLYVAVTRARRRLVVTWAQRSPRGRLRRRSPFLDGLGLADS